MLRLLSVLSVMLALWSNAAYAKFPEDPKPCKYEDSECIIKIMNYLFNDKSDGYSALNFVKIDPLNVAKINIKQGEDSPVNIDLTFIKNDIFGWKHCKTTGVKGFGKDLTKKHELQMTAPYVSLVGNYSINGRVLVLPISGSGKSNITMYNPKVLIQFVGMPLDKDGETYMSVNNIKLQVEPEKMHFQFDNLFNGDKALGENMNLFLNENWKDIFNEVRVSLTEAFAKIFASVINNVFSKYPYAKFFAQ